MELWIRSQDGLNLEKPSSITTYKVPDGDYEIMINNYGTYGIYSSKERVIKIINEIHSLLGKTKMIKSVHPNGNCSIIQDTFVYQMPIE